MSKAKKTFLVDDEFKTECSVHDVNKDDASDDDVDDDDDDEDVNVTVEIIVVDTFRRTFIRLFIFNIVLLSLINWLVSTEWIDAVHVVERIFRRNSELNRNWDNSLSIYSAPNNL